MISSTSIDNTLNKELSTQMNLIFDKYFTWFFPQNNPLTNEKFSYTWNNPAALNPSYTYNFTRNLIYYSFTTDLLSYGYETIFDDFPDAPCGK
jgi:hypothetical protein